MKITILGHHAIGKYAYDGQTIKTRQRTDALIKSTAHEVDIIDSSGWKKHPFRLYIKICKAIKSCDAIIMLPARNGLKVFASLVNYLNKKNRCKVYYDVIGGWLPQLLSGNNKLKSQLSKFDSIWVETAKMKDELEAECITNSIVIPNFKDIKIEKTDRNAIYASIDKRFCIFSRINHNKGISSAIACIVEYNQRNSSQIKLDIYGAVDSCYKEEFDKLLSEHSDSIQYKGKVAYDKSATTIVGYHALLFPTLYYTEGQPGTIIDAFFAGLPIISSKYNNYLDMLNETNSILYEFGEGISELYKAIGVFMAMTQDEYIKMSNNCHDSAANYSISNIIEKIETALRSKIT